MLYNWGGDKIEILMKNNIFIINLARFLKGKNVKLKNIIKIIFYSEI